MLRRYLCLRQSVRFRDGRGVCCRVTVAVLLVSTVGDQRGLNFIFSGSAVFLGYCGLALLLANCPFVRLGLLCWNPANSLAGMHVLVSQLSWSRAAWYSFPSRGKLNWNKQVRVSLQKTNNPPNDMLVHQFEVSALSRYSSNLSSAFRSCVLTPPLPFSKAYALRVPPGRRSCRARVVAEYPSTLSSSLYLAHFLLVLFPALTYPRPVNTVLWPVLLLAATRPHFWFAAVLAESDPSKERSP